MNNSDALLKLKALAEDDVNYAVLLQDNTSLQGLVILLSNNDEKLVLLVLQIFHLLLHKPGGSKTLRGLLGLREQLETLTNRQHAIHDPDRSVVRNIALSLLSGTFSLPEKKCGENKSTINVNTLNSPAFRPKSVVLKLYGLRNETDVEIVRSKLLRVRGVVSIVFQLHKHRVLVYTVPDLDPELLVHAIRETDQGVHSCNSDDHALGSCNASENGIKARIVCKHSELCRKVSLSRSKSQLRRKADTPRLSTLPPYLEEGADLFEVDETRAAPELRVNPRAGEETQNQGAVGWLADFLERSFFW